MNKIMTPELIDKLGLKRVCSTCRPEELKRGKDWLKGKMCPQCGNHYDEFGNHNKHRAKKWIYETFKQSGFQLPDSHIESLYHLARLKVSQNEASYIETIEAALEALHSGAKME